MKKADYLNKRKELMNQAQKALEESDLELFNKKEEEIQALDDKFEAFAKAQANMNALKESQLVDDGAEMLNTEETFSTVANKGDEKDQYNKSGYILYRFSHLIHNIINIADFFNGNSIS